MSPDPEQRGDPFITLAKLGYLDPRSAMRIVLGLALEEHDRLLMVGLTIVSTAMGYHILGGVPIPIEQEGEFAVARINGPIAYIAVALAGWLQYRIFAGLVLFLGRAFGGKAEAAEARTTVAWWSALMAPVPVLQAVANSTAPAGLALAFVFVTQAFALWTLACCTAEAHRFKNVVGVLGVILGIALLLLMLFGGALPQ